MKKITLALSTVFLAVISINPAHAGEGFYAELSGGSAKNKAEINSYSINSINMGEISNYSSSEKELILNEKSSSFGIRFGYQFNEHIAIELGHQQYGEANRKFVDEFDDTIQYKTKSSATSAGIKGTMPLSDYFALFARAGIAKWDMKMTVTDSSTPDEIDSIKDGDNELYYGIGAEYAINETVSLGLEYTILDMGWVFKEAEMSEDFSASSQVKGSYRVSNLALLLKISF